MSHYEARLEQDLSALRKRVGDMADAVRMSIDRAVEALIQFDRPRLFRLALDDHPINRETRAIDALAHAFVARHLPAAGHLRFVSSVLRLTIALERIGDYSVTIGRVAVKLERPLPESVRADISALADGAIRMLERANRSFIEGDAQLARDARKQAATIDRVHDRVFDEMLNEHGRSEVELVSVLTILGRLERVSDQAKNIAEETLFAVLGETKPPKQYPVLFVDPVGDLHSPLAYALAHKSHPESGRYAAAGLDAPDALSPVLAGLSDRLGLQPPHAPVSLRPLRQSPAEYHVIVMINMTDISLLGPVPFHTSVVQWQVDPDPDGEARLELLAHELGSHIRELMELLRGPDAS